jgi:hypothetical protein
MHLAGATGRMLASWKFPAVSHMARWPRHVWTSIYTYTVIFVLFPLLCLLAYAYVHGWF